MRRSASLVSIVIALLISLAPASQATDPSGAGGSVGVQDLKSLTTWWSQLRTDNYASGTLAGDQAAIDAGYRRIRSEGLIETQSLPGTHQILTFWHPARQDNYTTCSDEGINYAYAHGYYFVRIEGYGWNELAPGRVPLYSYWHEYSTDFFSTATTAGQADAHAAGYTFVRTECYIRV